MNETRIISGSSEDELWLQVTSDLSAADVFEYDVILQQANRPVELNIDIDLGGGFEGGFELTTLKAPLTSTGDFRFALHKEHFLDEIGKFFGMQDVVTGYPGFDKHVVVKTNNEEKIKSIVADEGFRAFIQSLEEDFTFGTTTHDHKQLLEFTIEKGVTDPVMLRAMYHQFYAVLFALSDLD